MLLNLIKIIVTGALITVLSSVHASEDQLKKVNVTMIVGHEGFLAWYAKEKGWDKDLGLDVDLSISKASGIEIMNMHRENPEGWNITAVSSIPLIVGTKNMPLAVVGIANDRSSSTAVYVKAESNIFRVKGWNENYPNVYGSPELIEGKTFVIRNLSAESYALEKYLEIFNLDFSNVTVIEKETKDAVKMVENGEADGCVIWSPETFEADLDGLKPAAYASQFDTEIPIMIMVDKQFADDNDETVGKFLAIYLRAIDAQKKNAPDLVSEYRRFLKQYTGENVTAESAHFDLKKHEVIPLQSQLMMFERKGNRKSKIQKLESVIARSLLLILFDSSSSEVVDTKRSIKNPRYITDRYLRIASKYVDTK